MMWKLDNYGNASAIITENGKKYSYAKVATECEALAAAMGPERCLVFSLCCNEPGSLLGYITFINYKKVPLLVEAGLDRQLLFQLIMAYKPDYLWIPQACCSDFSSYKPIYTALEYVLLKTPFEKVYPLYEELGLLVTTSGSTGSPKLVRQSYGNIRSNTESIIEYLEINSTDRPITVLPMQYIFGLSILNTHLYAGASIILTKKTIMEKEFWRQFKDYGATSLSGVPYIYEMLNKLRFFQMNLPSLKTMTQAGGKLSPELHRKFAEYAEQTDKRFYVMYGATEATARMGYLPYQHSLAKYGCMGIAIPGGTFSLINEKGDIIDKPYIVGELLYKGPNVTLGYAECGKDLAKGDERQGILTTGDMAKRDIDGYYTIVGRKKRFLKIFGNRINLDEVEQLVKNAFPDIDCACGGIDDALYVFLTDAAREKDVITFLTGKTGLNRIAFHPIILKSIPQNESRKTLYSTLSQYYVSHQ